TERRTARAKPRRRHRLLPKASAGDWGGPGIGAGPFFFGGTGIAAFWGAVHEFVARLLKAVGGSRWGREDPRASILREPGRRALAGAAPRPHRFRRKAPPLTGSSLIPHPPTGGERPVADS